MPEAYLFLLLLRQSNYKWHLYTYCLEAMGMIPFTPEPRSIKGNYVSPLRLFWVPERQLGSIHAFLCQTAPAFQWDRQVYPDLVYANVRNSSFYRLRDTRVVPYHFIDLVRVESNSLICKKILRRLGLIIDHLIVLLQYRVDKMFIIPWAYDR